MFKHSTSVWGNNVIFIGPRKKIICNEMKFFMHILWLLLHIMKDTHNRRRMCPLSQHFFTIVAMLRQLILLIRNKPTNFNKKIIWLNINLKHFCSWFFLKQICVFPKHLRVNILILLDLLQIEIAFNGSYTSGNYKW